MLITLTSFWIFSSIFAQPVILYKDEAYAGGKSVDNAIWGELCRQRGESAPAPDSRYHEIPWGNGELTWERHSEFSTYAWHGKTTAKFKGAVHNHPFGAAFNAPGAMISGTRIEVRKLTATNRKLLQQFDQDSLCVSVLEDEKSNNEKLVTLISFSLT